MKPLTPLMDEVVHRLATEDLGVLVTHHWCRRDTRALISITSNTLGPLVERGILTPYSGRAKPHTLAPDGLTYAIGKGWLTPAKAAELEELLRPKVVIDQCDECESKGVNCWAHGGRERAWGGPAPAVGNDPAVVELAGKVLDNFKVTRGGIQFPRAEALAQRLEKHGTTDEILHRLRELVAYEQTQAGGNPAEAPEWVAMFDELDYRLSRSVCQLPGAWAEGRR